MLDLFSSFSSMVRAALLLLAAVALVTIVLFNGLQGAENYAWKAGIFIALALGLSFLLTISPENRIFPVLGILLILWAMVSVGSNFNRGYRSNVSFGSGQSGDLYFRAKCTLVNKGWDQNQAHQRAQRLLLGGTAEDFERDTGVQIDRSCQFQN